MRNRNWKLPLFCGVALLSASFWLWSARHTISSDEGRLRDLRQCGKSCSRLNELEHWLGFEASSRLGVNSLLKRHERRADAARQALLASGYLVRVQVTVTNLANRTEEFNERFRHIESPPDPGGLILYESASNRVIVICRPAQAAVIEEALKK